MKTTKTELLQIINSLGIHIIEEELKDVQYSLTITTDEKVLSSYLISKKITKRNSEYIDGKRVYKLKKEKIQEYIFSKCIMKNPPRHYIPYLINENIDEDIKPRYIKNAVYVIERVTIKSKDEDVLINYEVLIYKPLIIKRGKIKDE